MLELVASIYVTLEVCRIEFDRGVPFEFVMTGHTVSIPRDTPPMIGPGSAGYGYSDSEMYGAPCVKISVGGQTLFVLGPRQRVIDLFETE